jgi:hypothetical protein
MAGTLFSVKDPEGRTVHCLESRWKDHVCTPKPFMGKLRSEVERTIEDPDAICRDAAFDTRLCYYRLNSMHNAYIKVVAERKSRENYLLITAYPTANMKMGEEPVWLRKS